MLFILILVSFLPIIFWGYIFSYIDQTLANRRRFMFGIIAGIISTIPVLFLGKGDISAFESFHVFKIISQFSFSDVGNLIVGLSIIVFLSAMSGYLLGILRTKIYAQTIIIIKNIFAFLVGSILIGGFFVLFMFFFEIFPKTNFVIKEGIIFGDFAFNSFKLIIFYYVIIGFFEETSKHFHFLAGYLPSTKNTKEIVLFGVFVALGFAFTENILYLWNLYGTFGLSGELLKIFIFRSCFSLMLHVVCSAVLAHMFSIFWHQKMRTFSISFLIFLFGLLVSMFLHSFFDISLSLGWNFIPFIYFLGGYLYVSSIFYRETDPEAYSTKKEILGQPQ